MAPLPAEGEAWPLTVEPGTGVQRFGLRPVTGIDPAAVSPWWMQRRLMLSGIRAISPAVDVTNYVMLELGHPMHAHDSSLITGGLAVRFARDGEKVVTLDDVERTLNSADVLIVDDVATAAIGGVMGAGTTEVRDTTTDVLLEAAVWDPAAVSRTQRRLHLASEAGRRYERSVDPAISVAALDRCATLLAEIAGGTVAPTLTDWRADGRTDWSQPAIEIPADLPDRTAGVEYAAGTTARRLTQIGAVVAEAAGSASLTVIPPSWRPDMRQRADLVEEVLRLEGLESIPSVLPTAPAGRGLTAVQKRRRAIGKSLALAGFVEVLPTPFLPAGVFDAWGLAADDPRRNAIKVLNPLEADRPQLATTLLPGLLKHWAATYPVAPPMSHCSRSSRWCIPRPRPAPSSAHPERPQAHRRGESPGWTLRCRISRSTSRRYSPGCASLPGRGVGSAGRSRRCVRGGTGDRPGCRSGVHPARRPGVAVASGALCRGSDRRPRKEIAVGYAGQLHPAVVERTGLPKGSCAVELDLDAVPIVEVLPAPSVSPFPAVFQDISVVVDTEVASAAVVAAVRDGAGELLEDVRLFDVYTGPQIGRAASP